MSQHIHTMMGFTQPCEGCLSGLPVAIMVYANYIDIMDMTANPPLRCVPATYSVEINGMLGERLSAGRYRICETCQVVCCDETGLKEAMAQSRHRAEAVG